ncbi:MAG: response regulator [Gammaproteobacteria bacterium]|jgi:signal transduction histidine kinase/ActR/RegA family two-component response regulator
MKLRTQISLLLFLFGLIPLLVAVVINVPMIFDRISELYHEAHVQNLRAGFSDLDQHIARRHEMARLLARMPEPGMWRTGDGEESEATLATARANYVDWVNQILFDQLDITQLVFIDSSGQSQFWLDRNNKTGQLEIRKEEKAGLNPRLIAAGRRLPPGGVVTGPISFNHAAGEVYPTRYMQLSIISPVVMPFTPPDDADAQDSGVLVMYLDMGGLATAYHGNFWVHNNGKYLRMPGDELPKTTAFEDFRGLEEIFAKGDLALWEYNGQEVLWVPLFDTEASGPLWVGRSVDPSPITQLQQTIHWRIATVAIGLLLVVFVVARLIAVRAERLGRELTDGISRVLERDAAVSFSWRRPQELQELGNNLTRLAEKHAGHSQALQEYARQLEATNRYKSEFLANVSHELRTPLNSILLLSKMLAEGCSGKHLEDESRQARVIHDAGADLKSLIDNILDLSRIEARQMSLVTEQVNLRASLQDVIELLRPQFEEKQLALTLQADTDAPEYIETDSEKLRQILINFLSNAVKFTNRGGATVRLGSGRDQNGRTWPVAISVTDTGIGIPDQKRELVFEAFKQADGSTSRHYGGTGLGLAISRELALLMGGRIEVESEAGEGSTFTLLLPLVRPESAEDSVVAGTVTQADAVEQLPFLPRADYQGARVLLVDDDVRNLLALTPLLEQWNLEVMAAGDGQEALDTLETDRDFDLVFMDIMMPGMDGYEVIAELRRQSRFSRLPVIALTARAAADDWQRCLDAGASDCIVKPLDPAELKTMIDRYLDDASVAATVAGNRNE